MIAFACSHCSRKFQVSDEFAGRSWPCPTCSQPVTVPGPPLDPVLFLDSSRAPGPLAEFGPYHILSVLGKGGMGIVYRAHDPQLQREVAIKMLLPAVAAEAEARQRFLREARATAAIENDHVVAIYQVGEERGIPYLVMPFLKGETLEQWQQRNRPAQVADILRLGSEIATGLAAAHARGLIHRDVKPSNIWLEAPTGRVKILDFGLARVVAETGGLTQTGMVAGTPAFMAPEQARAETLDQRCDLFSLGTVLYGLCTGELPFQGRTTTAVLTALALDTPPAVAILNPALPRDLADLVMQLLAKNPAERPRSAREVIERLQAIERSLEAPPATPVGTAAAALIPPRTDRGTSDSTVVAAIRPITVAPLRRRRAVILAGLLAGLAATGGALWLVNAFSRSPSAEGRGLPPTGAAVSTVTGGQRPVKVFVLGGQSDMGGRAAIRTLDWLGQDPQYGWLLSKIKNPDGSWVVRDDVWVYYQREQGLKRGPLTVGFGQSDQEIGPELLFGNVLGDAFENQVLLIKVIHGPLRLAVEGRPPSSGGETGPYYRQLIATVRDVVANIAIYFPDYADQGCEIAGFVWYQGWNDHLKTEYLTQYEANLVNLIKDVRLDWRKPNLPVVVGEFGIRGRNPSPEGAALRKVQSAAVKRPEFAGNVVLVDTAAYWDEQAHALFTRGYDPFKNQWKDEEAYKQYDKMGSQPEYLYMGSGKIMALTGYGFGEASKHLCAPRDPQPR